jgi:hypothetical protein
VHFKDGIELGDLQQILHAFSEIEELELALLARDGGVAVDEFSHPGRVDIADLAQIQQEFLVAGGNQILDGIAEKGGTFAEGDATDRIDDGDIANLAGG